MRWWGWLLVLGSVVVAAWAALRRGRLPRLEELRTSARRRLDKERGIRDEVEEELARLRTRSAAAREELDRIEREEREALDDHAVEEAARLADDPDDLLARADAVALRRPGEKKGSD